jgi:AcrR family transcriptional regulator
MATTPSTGGNTRSTAAERREHLLEVAMREFALRGFVGGSTERIAAAAGISQPYVFRLFGSKLQLFLATLDRCFELTLAAFEEAAADLRGETALDAIGESYRRLIEAHPMVLRLQLVGYACCDDDDVRAAMRTGVARLVRHVEQATDGSADPERVARFFAKGMLLNVLTAMQLTTDPTDWGSRLVEGCTQRPGGS